MERTGEYCRARGAQTVVFDVRDYFRTPPALAPLVLHAVTQYFLLHRCTHRGINMAEYLEMHVHPYADGESYF